MSGDVEKSMEETPEALEAAHLDDTKYAEMVRRARDGMVIVQDGVHQFANQAMSEICGYTIDEIVGMPFLRMVVADYRKLVASRVYSRAVGKDVPTFYEIKIECKNRAIKDVQLAAATMEYKGRPASMAIVRDATERKRAEKALKESEARFRGIYTQSPIPIILCDSEGKMVNANQACLEVFGLTDFKEFKWPGIFDDQYVPSEAKAGLRNREVVRYEVAYDFDAARQLGFYNGRRIETSHLYVVISPLASREAGAVGGYLVQLQDMSDWKNAEKALRDLSARLVDIQECERRHVARELHDQIGQSLTGLKLLLEMAGHAPDGNSDLREARTLIDDLLGRVRSLSLDLRPSMLDDLGLLPTLEWHFERYTAQTGIEVSFESQGLYKRFAPELETAVYRITQESLTNVARHAGVKNVSVRLAASSEILSLEIADNGIGFDTYGALMAGASSGLVGMRERAISLGGKLALESTPGRGSLLMATLPASLIARRGEHGNNCLGR